MAPSKVTTKGDVFVGTGSNAISRLAVGTNNFALEADSAQSEGVKWTDLLPSGLIMMKSSANCPSGWTEYTSTRGRALVGVPSGGSVEGTVGSALTDLQDKTHSHTGPSHSHTISTVITAAGSANFGVKTPTSSDGTGATSTSAAWNSLPYVQLLFCEKD